MPAVLLIVITTIKVGGNGFHKLTVCACVGGVCVCACVRACVRVCVCVCVCVCD